MKAETGCLQFIPNLHRAPVLDHRPANNDPTSQALECISAFDQVSAVACPLKPGGATVHHHRTLHCTARNISDVARFTYTMTFGVIPRPLPEKRTFPWLTQRRTRIQVRKRKWLWRGGLFVTVWRRFRRGGLRHWRAAGYGVQRCIPLPRKGM